jgi:hypothetical protein
MWILVLGLIFVTTNQSATAMSVEVIEDQMILSGDVTHAIDAAFSWQFEYHNSQRLITTVVLRNSRGGYVTSIWSVMRSIRSRELRTVVSGHCFSACALLFLSGAQRHFADEPAEKTRLGFHAIETFDVYGPSMNEFQKRTVLSYIGSKADEDLVNQWITITGPGLMMFFDTRRLPKLDGIGGFLCVGREKNLTECAKLQGKDVYTAGIVTSPTLIKVKKPLQ